MNSNFRAQETVGIFAGDFDSDRPKACFLRRLEVHHFGFPSAPLEPAHIHTKKHPGPVSRFGAARAGMQCHNRIASIVRAREHRSKLQGLEGRDELPVILLQFALRRFISLFSGNLRVELQLREGLLQLGVFFDPRAMLGEFFQSTLRALVIIPKIIGGGLSLEPRDFRLARFEVKGPSVIRRVASRGLSVRRQGHQ
jgi:hypothetical protein